MNVQDLSDYARISKDALDLIKAAIPLLPKGQRREEAERTIAAAEEMLRRSDVELAKSLGMKLCDCTFPPQIMLWREAEKARICPNPQCNKRIEEPKVISGSRCTRARGGTDGSWMG
jgi:hypothetical protein